jgi:hypothetical protein
LTDTRISDLSVGTAFYITTNGTISIAYTQNAGTNNSTVNHCGANTNEYSGNDVCNVIAYHYTP